jgi:hypothetical protein
VEVAVDPQQSYTLTLQCGCIVYVSCHPRTGIAHTRVIERRGASCQYRRHDVGARLWLWEVLPPSPDPARRDAEEADAVKEWME